MKTATLYEKATILAAAFSVGSAGHESPDIIPVIVSAYIDLAGSVPDFELSEDEHRQAMNAYAHGLRIHDDEPDQWEEVDLGDECVPTSKITAYDLMMDTVVCRIGALS